MGRRGRRKPRGSRGVAPHGAGGLLRISKSRIKYDLNVPLTTHPSSVMKSRTVALSKQLVAILSRLTETGYSTVALSHTVYGRVRQGKDDATIAVPVPSPSGQNCAGDSFHNSPGSSDLSSKKRKRVDEGSSANYEIKRLVQSQRVEVLRRLNVVVEELSDVGVFSGSPGGCGGSSAGDTNAAAVGILRGYDIIGLNVKGDTAFSAACSSANLADVLMLDYSRGRLPFRLRPADLQAATSRDIAFELCYGPAIADQTKRKFFIHAASEFAAASVGVRPTPKLILTSGIRKGSNGDDLGVMVLRTPGDMENVMRVVLGLHENIARAAMGESARTVYERGRKRRAGTVGGEDCMQIFSSRNKNNSHLVNAPPFLQKCKKAGELLAPPMVEGVSAEGSGNTRDGDEPVGDGFIDL